MANSDPPPPRSVRVSIGPDGVEIESSYERDTLTRVVKLAKELAREVGLPRPALAGGMGFTSEIHRDTAGGLEPDDDDA